MRVDNNLKNIENLKTKGDKSLNSSTVNKTKDESSMKAIDEELERIEAVYNFDNEVYTIIAQPNGEIIKINENFNPLGEAKIENITEYTKGNKKETSNATGMKKITTKYKTIKLNFIK
jgi:hypothetical protein